MPARQAGTTLRFLLIDRIVSLESGKRAAGIKNVTLSEDFFTDHFPDHPIMPGALITECLVQLADWVLRESTNFEQVGIPCAFDRVKFHRLVRPGDQLRLQVEIVGCEDGMAAVRGNASCDGKVVTAAQFTMAMHPAEAFQCPEDSRRVYGMIWAPEHQP